MIVLTVQQVRSSVGEVEYFEVGAIDQRSYERSGRRSLIERVKIHVGCEVQGQLTQVSKDRRSPADRKMTEA